MNREKVKKANKLKRKIKVRSKITGTPKCPRLNVFKSNTAMYLQLINDEAGKTLASAHSGEIKKAKKAKKVDISFELGKLIAQKAKEKKIEKVVFDRAGYKFHGRVKAVAEGAREGGLIF